MLLLSTLVREQESIEIHLKLEATLTYKAEKTFTKFKQWFKKKIT